MKLFPDRRNNTQKGSALFLILIGVALFAALSYTVAQIMRSGNPNMITEEKARLYADEILNYARALRQATQSTRISGGCSTTGISFENAVLAGYAHSPVVADRCKVFHEDGGAMNYMPPGVEWLDMVYTPAPAVRGRWVFPANICFLNVGNATTGCDSDSEDNEALVAWLPYVRKEVCAQLNILSNVSNVGSNPPPLTYAGNLVPVLFTGTQTDGAEIDTGGKIAGCYEGSGTLPAGTYHFYQVLLPR